MRLIKLRLKDFRRFSGEHTLDLNENLIALVGPNEAGKSSLLYAIDLLGRNEHPQASDVTRGQKGPAVVTGLYVLDEADRTLLEGIHQGASVTRLWVELRSDAKQAFWTPEPRPRRSLEPRLRCLQLADALQDDPGLDEQYSAGGDLTWDPQLFVDVRAHLASNAESLSASAIQSLESLAKKLRAIEYPSETEAGEEESEINEEVASDDMALADAREAVASALVELAEIERKPTPETEVIEALETPEVAWFAEVDRELQSDYSVEKVVAEMPPALAHLCQLGNLDLGEVHASLLGGRIPHVEKIFERANSLLRERFKRTWTQSTVYPRLTTPTDGILRILIATEGDVDYSFPAERSDGLRWFIALHSFLAARGQREPVLLVDEAETHLHYDAQADLIDALMSQRVASKVIYTTHSVGCLPPDLGTGIRAILADGNAERSRIANSYWSVESREEDRVGYAPLLFAMGARLLSLTIPRYGVVAEGPSDAILLPSLIREAVGVKVLPYRIVPGLSELAESRVFALERHAGKVACLADDDAAGKKIQEKLLAGGLPEELLLSLGRITPGCTLEDLVSSDIFSEAVNCELETWDLGPLRIQPSQVPTTGRWKWLELNGKETGTPIERLSKPRVAQRAVDLGRLESSESASRSRVDPVHVEGLRSLHEALLTALEISRA